MKKSRVVVGIDIGTTNTKILALDLHGEILEFQKSTTFKYTKENTDFFDIKRTYQFIKAVLVEWTKSYNILGVSASSVGESVIPLLENGSYRDPIVWYSNATAKISTDFWRKHNKEELYVLTGLVPGHIFSVFKIMLMQKNVAKVHVWLPVSSFILYKLGAKPFWDYSQASRTMLFNLHTLNWDDYLLRIAGVLRQNFPQLAASGTQVGFWENKGKRIPLFLGAHDHIAGMFAIEKLYNEDNFIYDSMGTAESFTILADKDIKLDREYLKSGLNCGVYITGERLYLQRSIIVSGGLISWLSSLVNFSGNWSSIDKYIRDSGFDIKLHHSPKGIFVDFYNVPYDSSGGVFVASGIKFILKRSEEIVQDLRKVARKGKTIFISGGLMKNPSVKSAKRMCFGKSKVYVLKTSELTSIGTALLAASGLNIRVNLPWKSYVNVVEGK